MKIVQHLAERTGPSSSGTLRAAHFAGGFVKRVRRAGLPALALMVTVVLATGCSSTGTGLGARLIHPVSSNQPEDGWYPRPMSPALGK